MQEYKNKLIKFYRENKRMPSYSDMLALFNFKSKNAVYKVINKLIESGLIEKDSKGHLSPSSSWGEVPLLGLVKAGVPSAVDVDESLADSLNIEEFLIKNKENTFMLEVDGDSMIDAHIEKGDLVIAEKSDNAKEGDIVIAEVDGEWTMKYFKKKLGKVYLEPANKNYKNIYPKYSIRIAAVVKAVIRKY